MCLLSGGGGGALGFGLSFPHRRGPYGPTGCPYGEAGRRHTSHTPQPRGRRAGHTPPSAVVHVLLDIKAAAGGGGG